MKPSNKLSEPDVHAWEKISTTPSISGNTLHIYKYELTPEEKSRISYKGRSVYLGNTNSSDKM